MELKKKYVAPYFSYELGVIVPDEDGECLVSAINEQSVFIDSGCDYPFEEIKLVLFPLSYLTKEIEIDGEKFIPMQKLCRLFAYSEQYHKNWSFGIKDGVHYASAVDSIMTRLFEYNSKEMFFKLSNPRDKISGYDVKQFEAFEQLFEWHFDLFNLIPENLAIDITTL